MFLTAHSHSDTQVWWPMPSSSLERGARHTMTTTTREQARDNGVERVVERRAGEELEAGAESAPEATRVTTPRAGERSHEAVEREDPDNTPRDVATDRDVRGSENMFSNRPRWEEVRSNFGGYFDIQRMARAPDSASAWLVRAKHAPFTLKVSSVTHVKTSRSSQDVDSGLGPSCREVVTSYCGPSSSG